MSSVHPFRSSCILSGSGSDSQRISPGSVAESLTVTLREHSRPAGTKYSLAERIEYQIEAVNTGTEPVTDVQILDSLESGSGVIGRSSCLMPGTSASFTYPHSVSPEDVRNGFVSSCAAVCGLWNRSRPVCAVSSTVTTRILCAPRKETPVSSQERYSASVRNCPLSPLPSPAVGYWRSETEDRFDELLDASDAPALRISVQMLRAVYFRQLDAYRTLLTVFRTSSDPLPENLLEQELRIFCGELCSLLHPAGQCPVSPLTSAAVPQEERCPACDPPFPAAVTSSDSAVGSDTSETDMLWMTACIGLMNELSRSCPEAESSVISAAISGYTLWIDLWRSLVCRMPDRSLKVCEVPVRSCRNRFRSLRSLSVLSGTAAKHSLDD